MHLAAFNGSERCLRKLLHSGANADVPDKVRAAVTCAKYFPVT